MKVYLLIVFTFVTCALQSQSTLEIPDRLEIGIKKGDAKMVAGFFNQNVELSIEAKNNIYSRKQAELVLQKFFRAHTPQNFYINHQGRKTRTSYIIGNLITKKGDFKLVMLLKRADKTIKIHQLRIDNEK